MANKGFVDGPAYVASSAADLYSPSSGITAKVRHIHLSNKDSSARTVSVYLGASGGSAGGTELLKDKSIAIADTYDLYFPAGLIVVGGSTYISAIASSASAIVATITGDLEVS